MGWKERARKTESIPGTETKDRVAGFLAGWTSDVGRFVPGLLEDVPNHH